MGDWGAAVETLGRARITVRLLGNGVQTKAARCGASEGVMGQEGIQWGNRISGASEIVQLSRVVRAPRSTQRR